MLFLTTGSLLETIEGDFSGCAPYLAIVFSCEPAVIP